ncbi:hypothetical protein E2C01_090337 [Portunus trituberculatus]|uniref:Uncharacterized protein n=1 Tax=Portunus trituberculatus TaxID=210409 RepID=A0A5B7JB63_PORTR|nr:hypothetical protein [Portunus trituberculatus]
MLHFPGTNSLNPKVALASGVSALRGAGFDYSAATLAAIIGPLVVVLRGMAWWQWW